MIAEAVASLIPRLAFRPTVGLILGSGLGGFADRLPAQVVVPYADIPGFPTCSVEGHAGRLVLTERCGPRLAILQGRAHRYEGLSLDVVTRPLRVLAALGIDTVIVTCAAGALGDREPGSLMLIEDHLNLMGDNPLIGTSRGDASFSGFVVMTGAYDPALLALAERVAAASGIPAHRGVLAGVPGPCYETPAEAAMLARLGAHAVSMSVVPEVIVARALHLRVLGLAVLTNRAGARGPVAFPEQRVPPQRLTHQEVVAMAESRAASVRVLLEGVLGQMG